MENEDSFTTGNTTDYIISTAKFVDEITSTTAEMTTGDVFDTNTPYDLNTDHASTFETTQQYFVMQANGTVSMADVTQNGSSEMYPLMDENVGKHIALGFFFAFMVAVIVIISVVAYCCLKRRKKMKLEKSIIKVENPKYASQPSRYPQSFDFISSQNVRAEFKNKQDESSVNLLSQKTSPQVTISIDNHSNGTSLYSTESMKTENKRFSKSSDFPGASVASIRNDSSSDFAIQPRDCNENKSVPSSASKAEEIFKSFESPINKRVPITCDDYDEPEGNAGNSESLSLPLLDAGDSKAFDEMFLKSRESEIIEDDDDEDENNQSTTLLKSKEQSMLSLGSYDRALNPFCD